MLSHEQEMARDLEQMMAQDLGPVPAVTPGFPARLDDAALATMVELREGFAFSAFFSEREWSQAFNDLMEHQRMPRTHHAATPLGRLEREVDAHYLRWSLHTQESAATLLALLNAAEAALLYDWEIAAHVWTHARELEPAPVAVLEGLDHYFRVIRALHIGAAITGPVMRDKKTGVIEVPPGLAAAAAHGFPDADAGSFDSEGALALSVLRGRVVLLHRGVEQVVTAGEEFFLRRLDVVRVPAAATLGHSVLGEIEVAAGSEITAGNASRLLLPGQRELVAQLVAAMRGPGSDAYRSVEAMLPFAYPRIRANYMDYPGESSRMMMLKFDGE
ncbi:MAG: hypothetical protein IPO88_13740 [Nannocystis sp.]|nr:hypothetical protein [Nannocystis sp.]